MRIGLMLRHLGRQPGGTGTYTNRMIEQLLALDQRNTYVLLLDSPTQRGIIEPRANMEEVVLRLPNKLLWDQVAVPLAARRHKIDLLFNLKFTVPLLTRRPTVFVQHGADGLAMPTQYPLTNRLYLSAATRLYWAAASGVVCISQDTRNRFIAEFGEQNFAKTCVIYHGVNERFFDTGDPQRLAEVRRRYGLDGPYILYLGLIYAMKNVGRIIQAYGSVRERIGRKLVIAGKPVLTAKEDLAWIDRLGLGEHVIQTGYVPDEDVPYLMRMADLFVFPSLYEGFGIPLIEAMAAGCPVLTSTGGSCPEVAGDAAVIVDPTSVADIAEGICKVLENPALKQELVSRGARRAREFTWANAATQTIQFLESVAARASRDH